jgi:hypothetical protein
VCIFILYLLKPYSGDNLKRLASSRAYILHLSLKMVTFIKLFSALSEHFTYTLQKLKAEIEPVNKWNYEVNVIRYLIV